MKDTTTQERFPDSQESLPGGPLYTVQQKRSGKVMPGDVLTDDDGIRYTVERVHVKDGILHELLRPHCDVYPEPFWLRLDLSTRVRTEVTFDELPEPMKAGVNRA